MKQKQNQEVPPTGSDSKIEATMIIEVNCKVCNWVMGWKGLDFGASLVIRTDTPRMTEFEGTKPCLINEKGWTKQRLPKCDPG